MGRITIGLLRKRAEHNEGCLSDLVEIALHQQEIEKLEVIGDACRKLEILYLCNNYIPKIENIRMLKCLKYLNLAVNNIKVIEGLEGCEMLERLDLTLNFIGDLTGVASLRANVFLETLYLTGNPCTSIDGYRKFIIDTLPQLQTLDGSEVVRSEQILARQDKSGVTKLVDVEKAKVEQEERLHAEMRAKGIDPFPAKYNEQGERVYGHSAEERMQMLREQEEMEAKNKNKPVDPNSITGIHAELNKKPKRLTIEEEMERYGRVMFRNEAKIPHRMEELDDCCVLHVEPGRFISTQLINVDADVNYIRVTVKDKLLQMPTPEEISVSGISVQRAATTGALKVTMPFAQHILQAKRAKARRMKGLVDDDEIDEDDHTAVGHKKVEEEKPKGTATAAPSKKEASSTANANKPEIKTRVGAGAEIREATTSSQPQAASSDSSAAPGSTQRLPPGPRVASYVEELE